VNTIVKKNATNRCRRHPSLLAIHVGLAVMAWLLAAALTPAHAQGTFANPIPIGGYWGSTNVDNTSSFPDAGMPNIAGVIPSAPVWFQFYATNDGEVSIDTIGSVDSFGLNMDTVLAVYGGTNLPNLYQLAANDDLYPNNPLQYNYVNQNTYSVDTNSGAVTATSQLYQYFQPFTGPSSLRFTAKAGNTYYIVADSKYGDIGNVALNWAYHSSGVFRFASENVEQTGITDIKGNPVLLYQCASAEGKVLLTVTRVAGYTGRMLVDFATASGTTNLLANNGDDPAVAGTDFVATSGTLTFDDFEMSKTIAVTLRSSPGTAKPNRDFTVALSNPRPDPAESSTVSAPRVDPVFYQTLVRILNPYASPAGAIAQVNTNVTPNVTNYITANAFNFDYANYRMQRPINTNGQITYTIYVNRTGTLNSATNIYYAVDSGYPFRPTSPTLFDPLADAFFPLQPGSDYATPDPQNGGNVLGNNPDFIFSGGYTGTLAWGDKDTTRKAITFTVYNNGNVNFNEDFHIELYALDGNGNVIRKDVGMIGETTVTLLFQDQNPPAGSVDEKYNADFNLDLQNMNITTQPPNMSHPGTDGDVYSVVVQPDNKSIIAGDFLYYNGTSRNCIARVKTDGSLDTSFNPGTGIGSVAGSTGQPLFINAVALDTNNNVLIAGSFTSFNGTARGNVARLTSTGSLDTTFTPGTGADGPVYAILPQSDGKIMIGGAFTHFNGNPANYLARLNANGTLDVTFNASNALNGAVWALAEKNGTAINASRSASGTDTEDDNLVNVGASSGVLTVDYDMASVPDDMKVFYGDTNGVLIYDTGEVSGTGHLVIPFGPTNGLTANTIEIVMNQGSGTPGTVWAYTASVVSSAASQIYVGGDFTAVAGVAGQNHLTRFLGDGSQDATFDPNAGINGPVYALALQPDGNLIAGGKFSLVNNLQNNSIVRLTADGVVDTNFFSGSGVDGTVYNLNLQNNGTFYVGGEFLSVNGTHRLSFARMNSDGTLDTTFMDAAYNQFAGLFREYFNDSIRSVYSCGVQSDGNVLIGGTFDRVGGGQYDFKVRPESMTNAYSSAFTRDGVRNRNNFARLIGGGTPGPGNLGFLNQTYSVGKSGSSLFVQLLRTNGYLGSLSANFTVNPILAQSGADFGYSSPAPRYGESWAFAGIPYTRMHSDGLLGTNTFIMDSFGRFFEETESQVTLSVFNDAASSGDLSAQLQMANPANADQFYLGGQNIPLGVALGMSSAPLTIVDDLHSSGVISFASTNYVSTGGTAMIGVVRTNGNYGKVTVAYMTVTNGSTALPNTDFVPVQTSTQNGLALANGVSSNAFGVVVKQTNYITSVEKFVNLSLTGVTAPENGYASLGMTNAILRIINPNVPGFLTFSVTNFSASIRAAAVPVQVRRIVGSKGTLRVQFSTADGTAIDPDDYTTTSTNLLWNDGDVSPKLVYIPLSLNNNYANVVQFYVNLTNPTLNGASTNNPALFAANSITNAVVTITNDLTAGTFQFSATDYTVNEDGGYATITIVRNGAPADLQSSYATVDYTTADNTAVSPNNYQQTSDTLFFDYGQSAATFQVPIVDDGITDPSPDQFYFTVNLSNPSAGAVIGTPSTAKVHILDASSYNRPPGNTDVTFTNGVTGMNGNVYSLVQQSSGSLIVGGDFTTVNGTVENNFARLNTDGSLDASGFLYGLSGANDAVYALANQTDDRIVLGGLFNTVNGVVRNRIARVMTDGTLDTSFNPGAGADGAVNAIAETFINGDRKLYVGGAFQYIQAVNQQFLARLNNDGSFDTGFNPGLGPNGVVYAVAAYPTNSPNAGQVLVGGAFTNINNFPVGYLARLNADGSVDTNFDAGLGVDGTVRSIVIQPDGGIVIGGDFTNAYDTYYGPTEAFASAHIARIYDDGYGYSYVDPDFADALPTGPNGTVNALALQADQRIIVAGEFTQANGVHRNNITRLMPDGSVDPTINFGDGANGAVYATLVQPTDQMIVLAGAFTQYNDAPQNHITRIYGGSVTGAGAFQFTSAVYGVNENGLPATITIRRVGGTSGTNTVDFTTADDTAFAGTNYVNSSQTVVFPPGEVLETVPVPVIDDGVITPNLTVDLALSNAGPDAGLGDQTTATLYITNVDSSVSFLTPNYFVAKNTLSGYAPVDVIRQGSSAGTATVQFLTTTNGSAVPGTDFTPENVTVTFNAGVTDQVVQIPILNNPLPTGPRTVVFALSNAVNTTIYNPSNATLTINDSVYAPGVLGFAVTNLTVNETDTNIYLSVTRTNGSSGIVSVSFTTLGGTAVPGLNYTPTTGTLTFADGQTNRTVIIPLLTNTVVQGPVYLAIQLYGVSGGATLSTATNASVTILNDNPGINFVALTNTVPENYGSVSVQIERLYNTNNPASVHFATYDITAQHGINYSNYSGTLIFGVGESLKSITIPIINDPQVTGDLTFGVSLSAPTGAQIITPSNTVVVVQDADAGISFTNSSQNVPKNAGVATVTVVCSNPRVEPVIYSTNDVPLQVNYLTVDGTAVAGVDYQTVTGTLVFTNGLATNTFTVPIYNNGYVTGARAFSVILTNVTAPGQITPYGTQSVVIAESNTGLGFSQSDYQVFENGVFATVTVNRTGNTNGTVSVDYTATNDTALAGVNFVPTSGTLVFTNGVLNQSFNVQIIDNPAVQPNLKVALQLSNPTNALLAAPSAATVTILEVNGSYVIPAGSQVVTNYTSHLSDGIISSNDRVQVLFGFRDAAGLNVTDLKATLLATNGVTNILASTQDYGPLQIYQHSVSRPFTFTAVGTNALAIAPTFNLYDGATFIGTASFPYTLGTWTTTFSNTTPIVINDNTNASPYPSGITVAGLGNTLVKATVTLTNFSHQYPQDIQALVVSPSQTNTLLMGYAGYRYALTNETLKFDDAATNSLPIWGQITNGVYKPTQGPVVLPFWP
jgi:uncharacterized delta-60 repeat protein